MKIIIEECQNGFIINKFSTEGVVSEDYVAATAEEVKDLIYNLLPKG